MSMTRVRDTVEWTVERLVGLFQMLRACKLSLYGGLPWTLNICKVGDDDGMDGKKGLFLVGLFVNIWL